mmetsp:Transcript_24600/g.49864  ORF Transcript_24600/g.49864 Transcript_24600/m.49864 type:complete len:236 (+) Transcript_24600:120-827(+)
MRDSVPSFHQGSWLGWRRLYRWNSRMTVRLHSIEPSSATSPHGARPPRRGARRSPPPVRSLRLYTRLLSQGTSYPSPPRRRRGWSFWMSSPTPTSRKSWPRPRPTRWGLSSSAHERAPPRFSKISRMIRSSEERPSSATAKGHACSKSRIIGVRRQRRAPLTKAMRSARQESWRCGQRVNVTAHYHRTWTRVNGCRRRSPGRVSCCDNVHGMIWSRERSTGHGAPTGLWRPRMAA